MNSPAPRLLILTALVAATTCAISGRAADLKVANLFSNGAVLQRDAEIPIWGTADPGAHIQVTFSNQIKIAEVSESGDWRVTLNALPASGTPRTLTVKVANGESVIIEDVLVGEVWLCAGQSNMAMRVDLARDAEQEKATSDLPLIRVYSATYTAARKPLTESSGNWVTASPATVGRFSATAFFFGRELHHQTGVPIGLIVAARGGSDITAWTSRKAQEKDPALKALLSSWAAKDAAYTPEIAAAEQAAYEHAFPAWKAAVQDAVKAGRDRPKKPVAARTPVNPRDHWHHPATLFNGMLAPLIPYAIRGAIWYQGESNAFTEETSTLYEKQLPLLIRDWRTRWGQGDFPFAWVQLPFSSARQVAWARIRESMRRALALPNTGMVVTLDLGEENLLHPRNKQGFAHRLALWARANVYDEDIAWSGPLFTGARAGEKGVLLRFEHADGLRAIQKPLVGFEYRAGTNDWKPITPRIRNNRIVILNPPGESPTAIRYAWGNKPDHNLVNAADLPASPFITEFAAAKPTTKPRVPRKTKPAPQDLVTAPFVSADISDLPGDTERLEIFLLMGQSNMKGRGRMPAEPLNDPRIIMMHKRTDGFLHARHPLHLVGSPQDFKGADNAGVGPGLAFAKSISVAQKDARVLLIPCAVGGTSLGKWQPGQRLYEETVRRAKLALRMGPKGKTRIAGALWLQGESDSGTAERIAKYAASLDRMITSLRTDLGNPNLPFIACTIGELKADLEGRRKINHILLDLPNRVAHTGCVDSRTFAKSIGDNVHFDTPTQQEHGRRYAAQYLALVRR